MRTRLGIAASLMSDPDLLIWDEPTAGLDPEGRRHTMNLIRGQAADKTFIFSSHILSDIDAVCSHVAVLHRGQLIFFGTVHKLKQRLRKHTVDLEFSADGSQLAKLAENLRQLPHTLGCECNGHRLTVSFDTSEAFAACVGQTMQVVTRDGPELLAIQSPSPPGLGPMPAMYRKCPPLFARNGIEIRARNAIKHRRLTKSTSPGTSHKVVNHGYPCA